MTEAISNESSKNPFPYLDLAKKVPLEQSSAAYLFAALDKHDENRKTGLPSEIALKRFISRHDQKHQKNLTAVFMDLSDFGEINRTLGHDIADEKLKSFGIFLKNKLVNEDNHVFHICGDEFILLSSLNSTGLSKKLEEINQGSELKFDYRSTIFDQNKHKSLMDAINESDIKLMKFKEEKRNKNK